MKRPIVTVVGSCMMDLLAKVPRLPKLGETLIGDYFHLGFGGKGANQAVMAAKMGAQVYMVNKVGNDIFGQLTLKNYKKRGINTRWVFVDKEELSGVAPILVDRKGDNLIVIVPGANLRLTPREVRAAKETILASEVVISQLEIKQETVAEAFTIAKEGKVLTILNPAPARRLKKSLLSKIDILIPNESETEVLSGLSVKNMNHAIKAAKRLLSLGVGKIVLTLGRRGILLVTEDEVVKIPAFRVRTVDATGAGDAFIGSLATFLVQGRSMKDAIRRANAAAALSVTKVGTQVSFPTMEEVEDFLKEKETKEKHR